VGDSGGLAWSAIIAAEQQPFAEQFAAAQQAGKVPWAIAAQFENKRAICSAVFVSFGQPASLGASTWADAEALDERLARYREANLLPVTLSATTAFPPYYHIVAMGVPQPLDWDVVTELSAADLPDAITAAAGRGLQPSRICSY
jgi:hypothetical protein